MTIETVTTMMLTGALTGAQIVAWAILLAIGFTIGRALLLRFFPKLMLI
jgi:hypothetical protein